MGVVYIISPMSMFFLCLGLRVTLSSIEGGEEGGGGRREGGEGGEEKGEGGEEGGGRRGGREGRRTWRGESGRNEIRWRGQRQHCYLTQDTCVQTFNFLIVHEE